MKFLSATMLMAAKVAGVGQKTWVALVAALAKHFADARDEATGAAAAGDGAGGSGGGEGGGGDCCEQSGGIDGCTRVAELTIAALPSFTSSTHGFASKAAKVGAVWTTCADLACANLSNGRPSGVGADWLRHLRQAVLAAVPSLAADDNDEDGDVEMAVDGSGGSSGDEPARQESENDAMEEVEDGEDEDEDGDDEEDSEEEDDDESSDDESELGSAAGTDGEDVSDDDDDEHGTLPVVGDVRRRE